MAEAGVCAFRKYADIPRNDLSNSLHPGTRGTQQGPHCASADAKDDAAIQEGKHTRSAERPDRRRRIHQRAACRDRGPRRSRPLGGRLDLGFEQHAHRHVGGAAVSVHDAREAQRQRHRDRCQSADQPGETTPSAVRLSLTWNRGMELARHKEFSSQLTSRCISVILRVPGNEAQMRTRIAFFDSTSRGRPICRYSPKPT